MRLSGRKWYGTGEGPFDPLPPAPPALRNLGLETRLVGVSRENQIKRPPRFGPSQEAQRPGEIKRAKSSIIPSANQMICVRKVRCSTGSDRSAHRIRPAGQPPLLMNVPTVKATRA